MDDHSFIAFQNVGDTFSGVYYVENSYVKKSKTNKDFMELSLRDRSGTRTVRHWSVVDGVKKGDFVLISAEVEEYMDAPSIVAKHIERTKPSDMALYIAVFDNVDEHISILTDTMNDLKVLCDLLGDETLLRVVKLFYDNESFFKKFKEVPGSVTPYYGRMSGAIVNTARITQQCQTVSKIYSLKQDEMAVLLSASMLFMIGAVEAFDFDVCIPIETRKGILMGVTNLTLFKVSGVCKKVVADMVSEKKKSNRNLVERLLHCLISYRPTLVQPMTKEAIVLSELCRMDRSMVEAGEFIQNDENDSNEFTAFDPLLKRKYFKGCKNLAPKKD